MLLDPKASLPLILVVDISKVTEKNIKYSRQIISNGQSEVGNFTSSLLPLLCPRAAKINTMSTRYKIPKSSYLFYVKTSITPLATIETFFIMLFYSKYSSPFNVISGLVSSTLGYKQSNEFHTLTPLIYPLLTSIAISLHHLG